MMKSNLPNRTVKGQLGVFTPLFGTSIDVKDFSLRGFCRADSSHAMDFKVLPLERVGQVFRCNQARDIQ